MKKVLLLLIPALLIGFSGCKKEVEEEEKPQTENPIQKSVVYYFGGTWCPPCGAAGKPAIHDSKKQYGENMIVISCQLNGGGGATDPFSNTHSGQLAGTFGVSGVPSIFVGGPDSLTKTLNSATSVIARVASIKSKKAQVYAKPIITLSGEQISVKINAKFHADYSDEFRFAVYITESGLSHTQASDARTENKNMHDDVLRLSLTSSVIGEVVASSVKAGDEISKTYTGTLEAGWKKENLKAVVVFWKKDGAGVRCVNAESVKIQ